MISEAKVKKQIKDYLDALGVWYFMPVPNGYGRKGIPDIVGCYRGRFFAIEVKAQGKEDFVTPWQRKELNAVRRNGGVSIVCSNASLLVKTFVSYFDAL